MLKKLALGAAMATVFLFSAAAHASWLMVGPYQFVPRLSTTTYGVYTVGASADAAGYMTATLNLPPGSTLLGMWCQIYDNSSTKDINVNLAEVNTDNGANVVSTRVILSANSAGQPGPVQVATTAVTGSGVIKTFDNSAANGNNRFYSYILSAMMEGSRLTGIKGCAIQYQ